MTKLTTLLAIVVAGFLSLQYGFELYFIYSSPPLTSLKCKSSIFINSKEFSKKIKIVKNDL